MASKIRTFSKIHGSLRNHFLIAMPGLKDPLFNQSLTYICDHSAEGAMGILINRPMDILLRDVFEQMAIVYKPESGALPILAGGPVSTERGFVLHRTEGSWQSSMEVGPDISLTASRDIVAALADGSGPANAQFALGYAGWGAGQLEEELLQNNWLTIDADSEIIFNTPVEQRWVRAAQGLGVDINLIASCAGHA